MISDRIQKINASQTQKIHEEAKNLMLKGHDIIDLSAGEPDFPTPENIKRAGIDAITNNITRYTPNQGQMDLRKAVCEKLRSENNLLYKPEEIIISNGAKQSIFNAIQTIINEKDEVIIPSPYWVSYPEMVTLAGGNSVFIPTVSRNNFKISPSQLRSFITPATKALILCNPGNPAGNVYYPEELEEIAAVCRNYNFYIISDEIYEKLIYDGIKFTSFASLKGMKERTILINGVSKSHSMTGWRIGYAAAIEKIILGMGKIQGHSTSNASSVSQAAAVEALTGPQDFINEWRIEFRKRRDLMYKSICSIKGFECRKPEGAFFLFPDVSGLFNLRSSIMRITGSFDFAMYLLYEAGVAVVPGIAFGSEGHIRISYTAPADVLEKAVERIALAVSRLS